MYDYICNTSTEVNFNNMRGNKCEQQVPMSEHLL